jgi:hypothetical protein
MLQVCVMPEHIFWSSGAGFGLCAKLRRQQSSVCTDAIELRRLRINFLPDTARLAFLKCLFLA